MSDHKCFGCGHQVENYERHIHVGLDEWSAERGDREAFGLDDLLTFPFCSQCIRPSERGWNPEAHEIDTA